MIGFADKSNVNFRGTKGVSELLGQSIKMDEAEIN